MDDFPILGNENVFLLEPGQDLVLRDTEGTERLRLDAATGTIRIRNANSQTRIRIEPETGNVLVGGSGQDGDLLLYPRTADSFEFGEAVIHLNADSQIIQVGTTQRPGLVRVRGSEQQLDLVGERGDILISGQLDLRTTDGDLRVRVANNASILVGGGGEAGTVRVRDGNSVTIIRLDLSGSDARGRWGGNGTSGRLELLDANSITTLVLNGNTGNIGVGAVDGGNPGALFVKGNSGGDAIVLNGQTAHLFVRNPAGDDTIVLNGVAGNMGLGTIGTAGNLFVKNDVGDNSIHLSGKTGNINLKGDIRFSSNVADCAEEFDLVDTEVPEPGSVMVFDGIGKLQKSTKAYDTRAAGVVSGAGSLKPGLVLGSDEDGHNRVPIAVIGKVFCWVDASYAPIGVGDLLTTSKTPGHAMKAVDLSRAFGAVIGKALSSCSSGCNLIPILVTLQ
jgi:hypothetical protein